MLDAHHLLYLAAVRGICACHCCRLLVDPVHIKLAIPNRDIQIGVGNPMITLLEGDDELAKRVALEYFLQEEEKAGRACYREFKPDMATDDSEAIFDCALFLTEEDGWYGHRTTQTKKNKLFSYFAVQCRMRNVNLYLTACSQDVLDRRIRFRLNIRGLCFSCEAVGKVYVHLLIPGNNLWIPKGGLDTLELPILGLREGARP